MGGEEGGEGGCELLEEVVEVRVGEGICEVRGKDGIGREDKMAGVG